jgi:hypothetical protein
MERAMNWDGVSLMEYAGQPTPPHRTVPKSDRVVERCAAMSAGSAPPARADESGQTIGDKATARKERGATVGL